MVDVEGTKSMNTMKKKDRNEEIKKKQKREGTE